MKKFLSIVLSLMMVLSVGFSTTVAMAATVGSHETTEQEGVVIGGIKVNGKTSSKVTYKKDSTNRRVITFTYTGSDKVESWEFYDENGNLLDIPGDYTIIKEGNNTITVEFADDFNGTVNVNLLTDGNEGGSDADKNKDHKSPGTGAMAVTGLAVAGAGVAVLSALKRKNDAE